MGLYEIVSRQRRTYGLPEPSESVPEGM